MSETSERRDDTFYKVFCRHEAAMLLVEPASGRILEANPAAEKFYGYPRAQFRRMTVSELNAPLPGQASAEWGSGQHVFLHKLANGAIHMIEASISPVLWNGTEALFCILHDATNRAQMQRSLLAHEMRLRTLADHIPAVIYQCLDDEKFTFTYLNEAILQLTGYPRKAFLEEGMSFFDLYHPDDVEIVKTPFAGDFHITYRIRHKSGEWRWVDEWGASVRNDRGEVEYLEGIMLDVTAQKQAESALRESEQRYHSLFDRMLDGIYRSTHEGRFVEINPAMAKMFGYASKEEMMQVDIKNELYFSPDERGSHILDTGQEEIEVYRMRRKDGSEIWVEDHGYYVHDEQGNIIYHEGILRDVTERVQAQRDLRESQKLLQESQAIAGLGSYALDIPTGKWKSSEVLDAIFGIDETYPHTVEGWADLVHPDQRQEMLDYFNREVLEKRGRFDKEYKIVRRNDGAERWVHGMGELEFDERGRPVLMRGSIQDVTERKQAEEALRRRLLELEALYQISSSLRNVQGFEETLAILLDQTLAALDTDAGALMLYDPARNELRGIPSRGWFKEIEDIPVKAGEGVAGTVFSTGKPYVSEEFARDPLAHPKSRSRIPAGWGGACLPIRADAEVVGVLFVAVRLPRRIAPEQMRLLQSITELAGAALHRAKLFDETMRRAQEFESLYETSRAISAEYDLASMLQVIVNNARDLLNAASSGIYLFLSESNELELAVDTEPYVELGSRMKVGEGAAGRVAESRMPLRVEDYSTWEGRSPQYEGIPLRAVLEVPMLYGGELIGVLSVNEIGESERKYTEADERLLTLFASHAAGAIHAARLRKEALDRLEQLQTLRAVDRAITSSFDLRITLNVLLDNVVAQPGVDAAAVLLFHPHKQHLEYSAGRGFRTSLIENAEFSLTDNFAGRCVLERRVIHVLDPDEVIENQPFHRLWIEEGFRGYFCMPLIAKGEVKGVLEIYRRSSAPLGAGTLEFLEMLAAQAAISVDNAQLFDTIQRANMELAVAYEATIEGWSRALELRDRETQGHTQRVAELTLALARAVGIRGEELQRIRRGALLHDIGKMGISDRILLKKGKLTAAEWEIMRTHPTLALQMLQSIHYLRPSLDIPYCHHEKWDGTGYPRGLLGEQIPLAARLFAVADVWDALTSSRPYRKAWSKKRALAYIKSQSGRHFDPSVVEVFLRIVEMNDRS